MKVTVEGDERLIGKMAKVFRKLSFTTEDGTPFGVNGTSAAPEKKSKKKPKESEQ